MQQHQPHIKVTPNGFEQALSWLAGATLVASLIYCWMKYPDLPETIATKFNPDGTPKSYSGKQVLFVVPIIGLVTWVGMQAISRYPHRYNYVHKITPENAKQHYQLSVNLILQLNILMGFVFAVITWDTVQTARCECPSSVSYVGLLLMGAIGWILFNHFYQSSKIRT